MATVKKCDCCGSIEKVRRYALADEGLSTKWVTAALADLCESCATALRFKWEELKRGKR